MDPWRPFFAELSWPQVEALLASPRPTVLLLPLGATEPHGPHAALGTDSLISSAICRRAAETLRGDPELGALVLPGIDYGVTLWSRSFPGAIHISEGTVELLVAEVCASLVRQGLRHVLLVNGHFEPGQVAAVHRAADRVAAETGVSVGLLDLTRRERAERLTEEFRRAECHAGRYETSLLLAERPELVDGEKMRALPYLPVSLWKGLGGERPDFRALGMDLAYNGAPAEASAEEGEATLGLLVAMVVELARALVRGTGGRDAPGRSARSAEGEG